MPHLKHTLSTPLAAALMALACALPVAAQTGGGPALLPPDQLFASQQPGKFQSLYNEASLCAGLTAQLQANAAMYSARALTGATRAQREGDAASAEILRLISANGAVVRDTARDGSESLEALRSALAGRGDVKDAGGRVLVLAGARRATPLQLENLPPVPIDYAQALIVQGEALLADVDKSNDCLSAVNAIDISTP